MFPKCIFIHFLTLFIHDPMIDSSPLNENNNSENPILLSLVPISLLIIFGQQLLVHGQSSKKSNFQKCYDILNGSSYLMNRSLLKSSHRNKNS